MHGVINITMHKATNDSYSIKVKFWGTRGSIPTPGRHFIKYGGNSVSTLENLIFGQMDREYFPVSLYELSSDVTFNTLSDNPFYIDEVKVWFTHLIHPSLSIGYRIEYKGKVVVYATDCEISNDPEIEKINERNLGSLIKDADVLIADCQYTDEEYAAKAGWGHTAINKFVDAGMKYGVKNLFAFHHDPMRTDELLDLVLDNARSRVRPPMTLYVARDKSTIYP